MYPYSRQCDVLLALALTGCALLVPLLRGAPAAGQETGPDEPSAEILSEAAIGNVLFPHALHYEGMGLDCTECHHETQADRLEMPEGHQGYLEDFWLECNTCHHHEVDLEQPQSCSLCHEPAPSTAADQTLSSKVVIHRSCWTCHEVGTGQAASQACEFCHKPALGSS